MSTQSRPSLRVLIVDDEPLIRWSLSETLAERGHIVTEASTGNEAMRLSAEPPGFDAVLLDLRLPDSTDLGLLSRLRAASPRARIILMTAYGTSEVTEGCERLGAFRCVGKPFQLGELVSAVEAAA